MNLLHRIKSYLIGATKTYPINGFDVSEGVGLINWNGVRYSTEFNFCSFRACFGKDTDDQWPNNLAGVKSIEGYPWYPYFVPKFGNWEVETDYFLALWDAAGGSPMPPEIDVEYRYNPLNKGQTCSWLEKSANKISVRTGFPRLLMYSNKYYWDTHVETRDYFRRNCDLEVAQYNLVIDEPDLIPKDWENLEQPWFIWQYWNKIKKLFAPGNIDVKRFFGLHEDFVNVFGVLPYYAPVIPPIGDGLYMKVIQQGLKIRTVPRGTIIGELNAGEILKALNVSGNDSWVEHERGWSNVKDGEDVNMVKYDN